jgi:hypothetical protein
MTPKLNDISEREKVAVAALVEEYKTKWLQVLALDSEVNKWSASYLVALILGIAWLLGSDKVQSLSDLFSGRGYDNSYFILSIAIINVIYVFSMSMKGYQIQQILYYLHTVNRKELEPLIMRSFNSFEGWRRSEASHSLRGIGKTEWRRTVYFGIVTLLSLAVSFSIIWMYGQFVWYKNIPNNIFHNLFYYCVIIIHIIVGVVGFSTAVFNNKWYILTRSELNIPNPRPNKVWVKLLTLLRRIWPANIY